MKPSRTRKRALAIALALGTVGLVWLYCWQYEKEMARQARVLARADAQATARILGGKEQTTVPFTLRDGWIIVRATLAGHPCDCLVDTGASCVQWSTAIAARGTPVGIRIPAYQPNHFDAARPADYRMLASVRLGDYEVTNLPAVAYDPADGDRLRMPLLGNDFFRNTALTIDYRARTLTVRLNPPDVRGIPAAHCQRVPLSWTSEVLGPGYPTVPGCVAGLPAHFLVDTGARALRLAVVDEAMARGLRLRDPLYRRTNLVGAAGFFDVPWSWAGAASRESVPYIPYLQGYGFDAILGAEALQSYRVTLDFRHGWIQFDRYPPGRIPVATHDSAG